MDVEFLVCFTDHTWMSDFREITRILDESDEQMIERTKDTIIREWSRDGATKTVAYLDVLCIHER